MGEYIGIRPTPRFYYLWGTTGTRHERELAGGRPDPTSSSRRSRRPTSRSPRPARRSRRRGRSRVVATFTDPDTRHGEQYGARSTGDGSPGTISGPTGAFTVSEAHLHHGRDVPITVVITDVATDHHGDGDLDANVADAPKTARAPTGLESFFAGCVSPATFSPAASARITGDSPRPHPALHVSPPHRGSRSEARGSVSAPRSDRGRGVVSGPVGSGGRGRECRSFSWRLGWPGPPPPLRLHHLRV